MLGILVLKCGRFFNVFNLYVQSKNHRFGVAIIWHRIVACNLLHEIMNARKR